MSNRNLEIFEKAPVKTAVLKNALPAMTAMLMVLIYNLADTFFIGQTQNAILVASVSLATPVFLLFMAVGTIFGVGGTSVISRAMGEGRTEYAKKVCAFCIWSCVIIGVILSVIFLGFMDQILAIIGASAETYTYAKTYLTIVSLAGPFVLIANCYSNILRAEGQANKAMMGQMGGNLINVILDPIMILLLNWGIAGAAIATVIGNVFSAGYYIIYFLRGESSLSIHLKDFSVKEKIMSSVLTIGIPASIGSILMSVSNIVMNSMMSGYGDMAVAGIGVAMKVTMVTGMVCIGLAQGIQPLLGYCVGAHNWQRYKEVFRFSLIFAFTLSSVLTVMCYLFTNQIVSVFLTDISAFNYAVSFTKILLSTSFLFGVFYVFLNALQALGAAKESLIVNLSRQGLIYIPALFILGALFQETGLVWAQPVADVLSLLLAVALYRHNKTIQSMNQVSHKVALAD